MMLRDPFRVLMIVRRKASTVCARFAEPEHMPRTLQSRLQAAVEAAVSDNARVMALAGAAEHIAAGAPLYHPGMRDATMLTVRCPACQRIAAVHPVCNHLQPPAAVRPAGLLHGSLGSSRG